MKDENDRNKKESVNQGFKQRRINHMYQITSTVNLNVFSLLLPTTTLSEFIKNKLTSTATTYI